MQPNIFLYHFASLHVFNEDRQLVQWYMVLCIFSFCYLFSGPWIFPVINDMYLNCVCGCFLCERKDTKLLNFIKFEI